MDGGITMTEIRKVSFAERARERWGWFVVLGAVMLVLGVVAAVYVLEATVVSVLLVGVFMLVSGVMHLVQAWRVKGWGGFTIWTASGLFYAIAGWLVWFHPEIGAAVLTLLLGAVLIASGALRLWVWMNNRSQRGWRWLLLSGLITLLTGLLVAAGWPGNSVWLLGLVLSFDLLFQGATLVMFGLGLRRAG
jgi:uncharacterized membrane protein HdeD (DUF308 family)